METKPKKKSSKRRAVGVSAVKAPVTAGKVSVAKKNTSRTLPRTTTVSGIPKRVREMRPPISSPAFPTAPRRPRRRAQPPRAEPPPPPSPLAAGIRGGSRYIRPAYDAWVSTAPAAVMKQVRRISDENSAHNRLAVGQEPAARRMRSGGVRELYAGKLKIVRKPAASGAR